MLFRKKRGKIQGGDIGKHKFCPVCRTKLETHDAYCTNCGYSFTERGKRHKGKGKIKWRNVIFIIIILIIVYISIRYFNGQSIIPTSVGDALNFSIGKLK